MTLRPPTSRRRYARYREDLRNHETEGSRGTAAAHARVKGAAHRSFVELFRAFLGIVRPWRGAIAIALATVTVATGLRLVPPAATGFVLDVVLGERPLPDWMRRLGVPEDRPTLLLAVGIGLVAVAMATIAVGFWGRWIATLTVKRLQSSLRRRVFGHAVRLPLHRVHELKSGGAASVLREDAGGVAELVFSMLYNPWRAVVQLAGTLAILAWIDWRLLVGSLILFPTVFLTHRTWISRIRPLWRDIRHSRQRIDGHATESFGGMRVVRAFGRQRTETNRFIRNNDLMIRQELFAWWWSRGVDVTWSLLIPVASALLLWYGGGRILADREAIAAGLLAPAEALTVGDLVTFLFYLALLLEPLATLATSATAFQNSLAGLDRVLDLLDEPLEFAATRETARLRPARIRGDVLLRDLWYAYPPRRGRGSSDAIGRAAQNGAIVADDKRWALREIDLEVPAGATVAIVGPSGAGKTTLCNLIARFDDPTRGAIEIDGIDLRTLDVERYRRRLGVVEQDVFLFDGTIAENIAYGRRGADREAIARSAERAHAAEFIEKLERGYDTVVGERGVRLSGGQRQRLAIARAMLADPRILILDEATSSLDTESERLIQRSLEDLMRGRTSFVIAHRLSTIVGADLIVVLDDGRIAERGTHAELLAADGRYARMIALQDVGAPA